MTEHYLYPASQDEGPLWDWIFAEPEIKVRAGVAYCPICSAIMDHPSTRMTFDHCPVYLLICPVCSYEDEIS